MATNEKRSFFSTMFTRKTTAKATGLESGPSQQDDKTTTTKSSGRSWFSSAPTKPQEVKVEEPPKVVEPPVEAPPVEPRKLEDELREGIETAEEPVETDEDIEAVAERKFIQVLRKIGIPVALAAAACAAVLKFVSQ